MEKTGELRVKEIRWRERMPTKRWMEVVRDNMRTRGVDAHMVSDWGGRRGCV